MFYPSPKMAKEAPPETLAYLAMLDPTRQRPDPMAVVDVNPSSKGYGHLVGQLDLPNAGDEEHRFGWNACGFCFFPACAPPAHGAAQYPTPANKQS
jgi:selenium-binding protein 1